MIALTQWFKASEKPTRRGVYQVKIIGRGDKPFYAYYDHRGFGWRGNDIQEAVKFQEFRSMLPPTAIWRGIAGEAA